MQITFDNYYNDKSNNANNNKYNLENKILHYKNSKE